MAFWYRGHTTFNSLKNLLLLPLITAVISSFPATAQRSEQSADEDLPSSSQLKLTPLEREWVDRHEVVRVAFDGHFPPYSMLNDAGKVEGYAVDMFNLLAKRSGLRFKVSPETTWSELYPAAKNREVDAVATMVRRPEREQWFEFTRPYIFKSLVIMTREDDERIRGKQNLAGKTLAIVKDYQYVKTVMDEFPSAKPQWHDTMLSALNSVSTGNADAAITFFGGGHYVQTRYMLSNLKFAAVYDQNNSLESIGIRKDWPLLRSILDKALASITESERLALERKWLPDRNLLELPKQLPLTREEREWIKQHPLIRLGVDPEFHPFEFIDKKGRYRGYAADYIKLLNNRLGLNMEVVPSLSWEQAIAGIKNREIDVLPAVGLTQERLQYLIYTKPYIEFHRVIITRDDMPFLTGIEDIANLKVAVQANSSHVGFLKENSTVTPITYPTLQECLQALSDGKVDAMVGNIASSSYWIRRMNLTNLKVAAAASSELQTLHFAIRKDWPILRGIIQKGLNSIEPDKRREINERWFILKYDPAVSYGTIALIVMGSGLAMLLVLLWNWHIRRSREQIRIARDEAIVARNEANAANRQLQKMHMELETLIESRTSELVETERKFYQAQKMEAMGTLVGGVAHDFNNILTGILGSIYLARKNKDDKQALVKDLQIASDLGDRGADLIRQLLAFARKGGTEKSKMDFDAFIEDATPVVMASLPSNIEIVLSGSTDGLSVSGNAALLQQALLNLINNARDAVNDVKDPKIKISIERFDATPEFYNTHPQLLEKQKQYVLFRVSDNGSGISEDDLENIFDPFFTKKAQGKGTGLGLAMVFGTVRDHGGVIKVNSTLGQGSTFSVYIPTATGDKTLSEREKQKIIRGTGQTLLLADDDAAVLKVHSTILADLGYRILTASNGEQALELLKQEGSAIKLALLDVVMPKIDGITVAKQMRKMQPGLKIIFLSAYDSRWDLPNRMNISKELLLSKPCSVALLSRMVAEQLKLVENN